MNMSAVVMDSLQAGLACLAIGCALGAASSVFKQKKQMRLHESARAFFPQSVLADAQLHSALLALLDVPRPDLANFERAVRRVADLQKLFVDISKAKASTVEPNLSKTASSIRASFEKYLNVYYKNSGVRMKYVQHEGVHQPMNVQICETHVLVFTLIDALVHDIRMLVSEKIIEKAGEITLRERFTY